MIWKQHVAFILRRIVVAAMATVLGSSVGATETIGPWIVNAPDSASHISGTLDVDYWLNVVNIPVDVNTAFSGESILDDGFANSDDGLTFEVVFNGGATNLPGADLVLFDARFDDGSYTISTDFDSFSTSIALDAAEFIDSGEVRDYFYGNNSQGPFDANIWGGEIDLTDLGLGLNDSATAIRFTATGNRSGADPIGMGRVVPEPVLGPVSLLVLQLGLFATRRRRG